MNAPAQAVTERLIELACRAPSVHNTQPWRWYIRRDGKAELWADRDRQLVVADPVGRNLAISCGAALHHLVVAGTAMGVRPIVDLLPDPDEPDLLAVIHVAAGLPAHDAAETLDAIERRCTDRRRFTSWPIPETRLTRLAQAATGGGAHAIPILDVAAHFHAELLLSRALTVQGSDPRFAREQQAWIDHGPDDGIPQPVTVPRSRVDSEQHPSRFAPERAAVGPSSLIQSSDGLMAICSASDDQRAWLESGQVLSAVWLLATRDGLSLVPLSQAIEVDETRNALHQSIFAGMARPQILLRIGWQEIARGTLPSTPRRPLRDVLLDHPIHRTRDLGPTRR